MNKRSFKIGLTLSFALLSGPALFAQVGLGPGAYCMPAYSNTPCNQPNPSNTAGNSVNDFIDDFSTAGGSANITYNSTGCQSQVFAGSTENYFYKSCPTFLRVLPGQTITVTMKSGIIYDQGFAVYVDWNNNGVFAFPGEQVCATPGVPLAATPTAMSFVVPAAQAVGNYRMRARCAYFTTGTTIDPCALFSFGETEDFNVVVGAATVCVVLPIELIMFEAFLKEKGIELNWITAVEKNSDHFTIERSYDGEKFDLLGKIPAEGYSDKEKLYVVNDAAARQNTVVYYRLKEYDKNMKEAQFSKVITYYGKGTSPNFEVYPNPASSQLNLVMPEVLAGKMVTTEIYNSVGTKVINSESNSGSENSPILLNINDLDAGTYYIKVSDNEGNVMKKLFVKQ